MLTGVELEQESEESLRWQQAEDAAARQALRSLPAYGRLRQSLERFTFASSGSPYQRVGDRWFRTLRVDAAADQQVVVVYQDLAAPPRVLVDPNEMSAKRGRPVTLMWVVPSPDGATLACAVSEAGTEQCDVMLIDVDTGTPLAESVPGNVQLPIAWLPDGTGFYYGALSIVDGRVRTDICLHVLGDPTPPVPVEIPPDLVFPRPIVSHDGRYVAIVVGNTEPRTEYLRSPDGTWRPFLAAVDGTHIGVFDGDDFVAIVDDGHPRGRLVRIPVASPTDRAAWQELIPESDDVLRAVAVTGGRIVVGFLRRASAGLRILDPSGGTASEVELPGPASIGDYPGFSQLLFPMFTAGEGEVSFLYSTPVASAAVYRYIVETGELTRLAEPERELSDLVVRQIRAVSSDGISVPATVMYRAGLDLTRPQPCLLHGYGGYNVALTPAYSSIGATFTEAGGIFVLAHLRGGSEFGAEWWRQGRRDHKQQVFDDVYAIAEELIASGLTTAGQLAVEGGSNGGTMAGAVLVQRPDLWGAVVSQAPQLDLLGLVRDPVGYAICRVELGDPTIPEEAEWLRRISPRHNIKAGTAYPATLFTAGANDPRCPAWHARVMTAELREATTGDAPILLRVSADQGHGTSSLSESLDQTAEWLAFVTAHTGSE